MIAEATTNKPKTNFNLLKEGEFLSESQYYKFLRKDENLAYLQTESGGTITVDKYYVNSYLNSDSQYSEEVEVTKTELANIILKNPYVVMSVCYNKAVEQKEVKESLYELYPNKGKMLSQADYKKSIDKIIKNALLGPERIIKGVHHGFVNELGRLQFIDMTIEKDLSKDYDNRYRQVDTRTAKWCIVFGKKYVAKN